MSTPTTILADQHRISSAQISLRAIKVIERLNASGFSGELVGGCVRDLLLHRRPNDFDVCTNALPHQICKLFRRSRIIGRRFRLVIVPMGREKIQVATYRKKPKLKLRKSSRRGLSKKGNLITDNSYGTIEQDANRRDLTINSLYLHPADMRIVDYTNGYDDIQNKIIRVIGNSEQRYREDPVRMLRTIRFAAELDFQIDSSSLQPISKLARLICDVSHMRLADEISKLFFNGNARATFSLLRTNNLFVNIFPVFENTIREQVESDSIAWLNLLFGETDNRARIGQPLSFVYTLAAMLWHPYRSILLVNKSRKLWVSQQIATNILAQQDRSTSLTKEHKFRIREIWALQHSLEHNFANAVAISHHVNFRAALRLLELRSRFGELSTDTCERWIPFRVEQENRLRNRKSKRRKQKKKYKARFNNRKHKF